jgi:hypothetical protein
MDCGRLRRGQWGHLGRGDGGLVIGTSVVAPFAFAYSSASVLPATNPGSESGSARAARCCCGLPPAG